MIWQEPNLWPAATFFREVLPQLSPRDHARNHPLMGRSSGFRIILLAAPSHLCRQWPSCSFRSRLQQRVCGGFAPRFPAPTIELSNGVIIDSAFLSVKLRNLGFTPCNLYIVPKAKQEIDHVGKT